MSDFGSPRSNEARDRVVSRKETPIGFSFLHATLHGRRTGRQDFEAERRGTDFHLRHQLSLYRRYRSQRQHPFALFQYALAQEADLGALYLRDVLDPGIRQRDHMAGPAMGTPHRNIEFPQTLPISFGRFNCGRDALTGFRTWIN